MLGAAMILLTVPNPRDASGMYGLRLEPEDSLDVMLIGASNLYSSYYAPLAYEKEGFTSFPVAIAGMRGTVYETALRTALEHQHPDLLVVALWGFNYSHMFSEAEFHEFLDVIPLDSPIRKNAVETIIPEDQRQNFTNPLLKYHDNWKSIVDCIRVFIDRIRMSRNGYSVTKNFTTTTDIFHGKAGKSRKYKIAEDGMELLDSFLKLCREMNLKNVLFIRDPEFLDYKPTRSYKEALAKIEEAGYDFLNLDDLQKEMGIDKEHDWYNDGHLNMFGAEKYTCFLSDYIANHYEINTDHSPEVTEEWNYCASLNNDIISFLKEETEQEKNIYRYTQKDLLEGVRHEKNK